MSMSTRTLLTLICEAALEPRLVKDLERLGAPGWTLSDARGSGTRGVRSAGWDNDGNIRLEVICGRERAEQIIQHLQERYYDNYAMICYLSDVEVLRPQKF
ncbi:transcriptional regulator [uncultured Halopseudomonas sp.]|uniref:P-II family nitrogen regulator n=1 Tax=uncultured Halopseudomonas sp. TaxID=2901193 RepID=UPI0030EC20EA